MHKLFDVISLNKAEHLTLDEQIVENTELVSSDLSVTFKQCCMTELCVIVSELSSNMSVFENQIA